MYRFISVCFHRNLRGEKPIFRNRRLSSQQPVPPNHRLHHRLSSPVLTYQRRTSPPSTPDRDVRLRSSSTSQVRNSRLAFPSRVQPLEGRNVLTPELRSVTTPEQLVRENVPLAPTVVDLGTYKHHECVSSLTWDRENIIVRFFLYFSIQFVVLLSRFAPKRRSTFWWANFICVPIGSKRNHASPSIATRDVTRVVALLKQEPRRRRTGT